MHRGRVGLSETLGLTSDLLPILYVLVSRDRVLETEVDGTRFCVGDVVNRVLSVVH